MLSKTLRNHWEQSTLFRDGTKKMAGTMGVIGTTILSPRKISGVMATVVQSLQMIKRLQKSYR